MSAQHQFYLDRAEEARAGASVSTLENVRDRWLRSEAMWNEMAERSASGEKMRARIMADKADASAAASR
jgi:hypothetical protein